MEATIDRGSLRTKTHRASGKARKYRQKREHWTGFFRVLLSFNLELNSPPMNAEKLSYIVLWTGVRQFVQFRSYFETGAVIP
jgi:hypothetical protein